jgi:hypothetical protein
MHDGDASMAGKLDSTSWFGVTNPYASAFCSQPSPKSIASRLKSSLNSGRTVHFGIYCADPEK